MNSPKICDKCHIEGYENSILIKEEQVYYICNLCLEIFYEETIKNIPKFKLDVMNIIKDELLKNRNELVSSRWYGIFNYGRKKVKVIDEELDRLEESIYFLTKYSQ